MKWDHKIIYLFILVKRVNDIWTSSGVAGSMVLNVEGGWLVGTGTGRILTPISDQW